MSSPRRASKGRGGCRSRWRRNRCGRLALLARSSCRTLPCGAPHSSRSGEERAATAAHSLPLALRATATRRFALAYFRAPGLRQTMTDIPLEYFRHALIWLARQPEVDAKHIVIDGGSRGTQAALLLAVHFPGLVHGVIAISPS